MPIITNNILLVLTNPLPGRADEFNRWYSEVHLPEVLQRPGFVSARRFRLGNGQLNLDGFAQSQHSYLALYEIEGDADAALAHVKKEMESGGLSVTEALDPNVFTAAFTAITETIFEEPTEEHPTRRPQSVRH